MKAGEGVKLHFDSKQIKCLYDGLTKLYVLSQEGVHSGINEWVVAQAGKIIEVPQNRIGFIKELLKQNHGEEVWKQLIADNPNLATQLSYSRIQAQRQSSLDEFQKSLPEQKDEPYWQVYFKNNTWVFGYGLNGESDPNQHPIPLEGSTLFRNMPAGDSGESQQVFVI